MTKPEIIENTEEQGKEQNFLHNKVGKQFILKPPEKRQINI